MSADPIPPAARPVDVVASKCLDVCTGPVAVAHGPDGQPVVVKKLRSSGRRRALRQLAVEGRFRKELREVQVTGKAERKAARKAERRTGRDGRS